MNTTPLAILSLLLAFMVPSAFGRTTVAIFRTAEFANPDAVPDNVKIECGLPQKAGLFLKEYLSADGFDVQVVDTTEIPRSGVFLKLTITTVFSFGHAMTGHAKQITVLATLYVDGVEVAKASKMRDSMGGAFGGYKGSCSVLGRCCKVLGKDVALWARTEIPLHPAHTP